MASSRVWFGWALDDETADFFLRDGQRVFSYANKWDFVAYGAGVLASIGAGITLPLMNVVFGALDPARLILSALAVADLSAGQFVDEFSDFANLANMDRQDFEDTIDTLSCVLLNGRS